MGKYLTEFFGEFRKFALKGNVVDMAVTDDNPRDIGETARTQLADVEGVAPLASCRAHHVVATTGRDEAT